MVFTYEFFWELVLHEPAMVLQYSSFVHNTMFCYLAFTITEPNLLTTTFIKKGGVEGLVSTWGMEGFEIPSLEFHRMT